MMVAAAEAATTAGGASKDALVALAGLFARAAKGGQRFGGGALEVVEAANGRRVAGLAAGMMEPEAEGGFADPAFVGDGGDFHRAALLS